VDAGIDRPALTNLLRLARNQLVEVLEERASPGVSEVVNG
jgi:hypothetical protein